MNIKEEGAAPPLGDQLQGSPTLWRQTPGQFEGKKTWGCEAGDGTWAPISMGVACSAQYKTTAHGEQERADDPTSWLCVEGAGPANPPPTWNRANL